MAITWQTPGALLVSAASATSISPAYPTGCVEGEKLLLVVGQRPSTVNSGSVTTPANWNLVTSKLAGGGYGTTFAADTANTNLRIYERTVPAGGLSGTLAVSLATNNVAWAQILRLTSSNGSWDSVAGANGEDVTTGAAVIIACASNPGVTTGDAILTAMCIPTDAHTGFSAYGCTQTGATFGTWTQRGYADSGTGNDIGGFVASSSVTAGTATGNPTITATAAGTTTNVRGPGAFVRVREGALVARTGTMSATETGPDTIAASGGVVVQGSASAAEAGDDAFAASGGVSSGVSGSMAVTESGADTFAGSGDVIVTGSMAVTDGVDTATALGQVLISGLMSVQESGLDTATILGIVKVQGTASAIEVGEDTSTASGVVLVQGVMDVTEEGQDTFLASQAKVATGSMDATEQGGDDFASTGSTVAPMVKRGGSYAPTTRQRAVKHLVATRESEDDRRKAIAQIMAMPEVEQAPSQPVTTHHIPSLVSSAPTNFDLSPVIIGAAKSYTDTLRSFVAGEIQREADRIAANLVAAAQAKEFEAQQVMQSAMLARLIDEDEATALIFIMATA